MTGIERTSNRSYLRTTIIPALLAVVVLLAAATFAEVQNRKAFMAAQRNDVLTLLSVLRARLEGNINGNIDLVRGLIATIETEPRMSRERFAKLAGAVLSERSQIRNIAGAPGLVVRFVYPVEGNEAALGLDYRQHPRQRAAALQARDSGELVLAGPLNLVQGGTGFVGRFPVFYQTPSGARAFWGIVSTVVDADELYRDSGLFDTDLDIAITATRGPDGAGRVFFGDASIEAADPMRAEITVPSGRWEIAATPRGGWQSDPPSTWLLRTLMAIAGAMILVPIFITGRVVSDRQRYIARLSEREADLSALSARLGIALEASRVGVWEIDLGTMAAIWDERTERLYGYPGDGGARSHAHWIARVHPHDRSRVEGDFADAIAQEADYRCEHRLVMDDGEVRHIRSVGAFVRAETGAARIVGVNWDVSADVARADDLMKAKLLAEARTAELESAKARIEFNALHDSLTGLPNRQALDERLAAHVGASETAGEKAALLQIDIDRFKQINDTLGHAAGDVVLVHVAQVLADAAEKDDFIARIGGDEFVILRARPAGSRSLHARDLARLAEDLLNRLRTPVPHNGHEIRIGMSIGIAADTGESVDPRKLLMHADVALSRAKGRGRNGFQFFNEAVHAEIVSNKRVADDILSGLERNEFVAHYQPQFCARSLDIVGVEALIRWNHPTRGVLAPAAFMKIAEELNVVATLDRLILQQSLGDMRAWEEQGVAVPKVSVNVSARRLHDEDLIKGLEKLEIRPGTVSFELVESIFLDENDELIVWNVDRIKDLGIDIEIDDFGTGYASIVSLLKLKPTRLKIDRQLIMPILRSAGQRQLVGSIIDIGKSLGIEVLAEGVETMEHARILTELGCEALQGYAFERALAPERLVDFIQSRRWRQAG